MTPARAGLARETVERPDVVDPPADRPRDPPAPERCAKREREPRAEDHPERAPRESDVTPSARSTAATTPIAFWASFAPWLSASAADVTHCALNTGVRNRRVPRRSPARSSRSTTNAAAAPRSGETASATSTPITPLGRQPSKPPQFTASRPAAVDRRSDEPADERVARARREAAIPREEVPRRAPRTGPRSLPQRCRPARGPQSRRSCSATADPSTSGPMRLPAAASATAGPGRAARVATSVAIAFDASWKPFVNANAKASTTATTRPASMTGA